MEGEAQERKLLLFRKYVISFIKAEISLPFTLFKNVEVQCTIALAIFPPLPTLKDCS